MVPSGTGLIAQVPCQRNSLAFPNNTPASLRHFEDSATRLYHPHMTFISRLGCCAVAACSPPPACWRRAAPGAPAALTAADYARAEKFMTYNTAPLVLHAGVRASWLPGDPADRFWYRVTTEKGVEVVLVDPGKATKSACDLPPCKAAEREDPARAGAGRRTLRRSIARPETAWPSFATGISGSATLPPAAKPSSPRTASRTSATPPTTPGGRAATGRFSGGRPTRRRSRPSSRTSAASARCTWWTPPSDTRRCRPGSTRCPAMRP